MLKNKSLTLLALVVVLMCNVYMGRAEQTDFNPEVIMTEALGFNQS